MEEAHGWGTEAHRRNAMPNGGKYAADHTRTWRTTEMRLWAFGKIPVRNPRGKQHISQGRCAAAYRAAVAASF